MLFTAKDEVSSWVCDLEQCFSGLPASLVGNMTMHETVFFTQELQYPLMRTVGGTGFFPPNSDL